MKLRTGSRSVLILSAILVTALGTPLVGSATGLSNSSFHVRAENSANRSFLAIKPGLKAAEPGGSSSETPTAAPTSTPSPTGTPAPTTPPVSAQPNPASDFTWSANSTAATITGYTGSATAVVLPETYRYNGVDLPVTTVASQALKGTSIESVVLPRNMTKVGSSAFMGASSLKSVSIPGTITSIGPNAFYGASLESIEIPSSVRTIGSYAFFGNKLTALSLPDTVTSLGDYAFRRNEIVQLKISEGLTDLPRGAFSSNPLEAATIPSSINSLGVNVFDNSQLKSIYMKGNAPTTVTAAGTSGSFYTAAGRTIYYKVGATGYSNPWNGYTTATYSG